MASQEQSGEESSVLIPVSDDPLCKESTLSSLDTLITPIERFYVRSHFSRMPDLERNGWRLSIDGEVNHPLTLSFEDILGMPSKEVVATLECAGNSRSYVTPPAEGLAFRHGAVSTARWKGIPLQALMERAGLREPAAAVVFEGADRGEEQEDGIAFDLNYRRSLPLEKALHPDTLLAYEMNGEPLPAEHGFPVRMVVPGWYAMASVKWLVHVNVTDRPLDGFFQQRRYVIINEGPEHSLEREPVTALKVKSLITSPRHGEVIQPGTWTICGFAWSGEGEIDRVEVSTDSGRHWQDATLLGESNPNSWRQWQLQWQASHAGHFIIQARATDSADNTQPDRIPWNFRGYGNNAIQTIAVEVPSLKAIPG